MNGRRLLTALCGALLCSGLLTWRLSRHLAHTASSASSVPVRRVVVAAKSMVAGDPLAMPSLATIGLPASSALPGSFSRPEDVAGRMLLVPISSGEPIMAHDLADPKDKLGLAAAIPDGMRVVAVPEADPSTGFLDLMPGSHVDVLVSYRSDADGGFVSSMVLQNVLVLDRGTKEGKAAGTKPFSAETVELLVTPQDAARLTVATSLGKLTFALRNGTDKALNSGLSHVTLNPLESQSPKTSSTLVSMHNTRSLEQRPKDFTVETLSGGKSSFQTFSERQQ